LPVLLRPLPVRVPMPRVPCLSVAAVFRPAMVARPGVVPVLALAFAPVLQWRPVVRLTRRLTLSVMDGRIRGPRSLRLSGYGLRRTVAAAVVAVRRRPTSRVERASASALVGAAFV